MTERSWGYWTEQKLEILTEYLPAFTKASQRAGTTVYHDLFAGDTNNISRTTGEVISGSPRIALDTEPPFSKVVLFELPGAAERLEQELRCEYPGRDLTVKAGDCNVTIDDVLANLRHVCTAPTFAFVDQYAAEIHWTTLTKLASFKQRSKFKVELWLLFAPSMLPRGLAKEDPDRAAAFADRITKMYGTAAWQEIHEARLAELLDPAEFRYELVNMMRWQLEHELGYQATHTFEMKNTNGVPIYEMIFATDNGAGNRIMSHLYGKAAKRRPRMREEALTKLRSVKEQERGALTLFPPMPRIVEPDDLYQHSPPQPPYRLGLDRAGWSP